MCFCIKLIPVYNHFMAITEVPPLVSEMESAEPTQADLQSALLKWRLVHLLPLAIHGRQYIPQIAQHAQEERQFVVFPDHKSMADSMLVLRVMNILTRGQLIMDHVGIPVSKKLDPNGALEKEGRLMRAYHKLLGFHHFRMIQDYDEEQKQNPIGSALNNGRAFRRMREILRKPLGTIIYYIQGGRHPEGFSEAKEGSQLLFVENHRQIAEAAEYDDKLILPLRLGQTEYLANPGGTKIRYEGALNLFHVVVGKPYNLAQAVWESQHYGIPLHHIFMCHTVAAEPDISRHGIYAQQPFRDLVGQLQEHPGIALPQIGIRKAITLK